MLSKVSDLTDLTGPERVAVRQLLRTTIETIEEQYDAAKQLVAHPLFDRFGRGDASVAAVCQRNALVMTADLRLHIALEGSGLDSLNFNHLRALDV